MSKVRAAAVLGCAALALSACTSSGDPDVASTTTAAGEQATTTVGQDPPTSDGAPTTSTPELFASARGVTAEAIQVGIPMPDFAGIQETFGVDLNTADQQPAWEAAIAEVNERGGILGRELVPTYVRYLPVAVADIDRACAELAEDNESFIIMGGLRPQEGALCFTDTHETPFISTFGLPGEVIDASVAPIITLELRADRALRALVQALDVNGLLDEHVLGIVAHAGNDETIDAIQAELAELGRPEAVVTVNDTVESDQVAYAQNNQIIVERLESEGVSLVIPIGAAPAAVLSALDENGAPDVVLASNNGQMTNTASFEESGVESGRRAGSYFIGTADFVDFVEQGHQPTIDCIDNYESRSGDTANLRPEEDPERQTNIGGIMRACQAVAVLEAAATHAGADLDNESLEEGLLTLVDFDMAGSDLGSIRPDKRDFPDIVYLKEFDPTTERFVTTGGAVEIE